MRDFSGGQRALVEVPIIRLHGRRLSERLMRPAGAAEALEPGRLDVQGAHAAKLRDRAHGPGLLGREAGVDGDALAAGLHPDTGNGATTLPGIICSRCRPEARPCSRAWGESAQPVSWRMKLNDPAIAGDRRGRPAHSDAWAGPGKPRAASQLDNAFAGFADEVSAHP